LIPYWLFETEGGDKVTRRLINQPLGADAARYDRLLRSLALYRMAFGQPRQEDLLRYLESRHDLKDVEHLSKLWQISLAPDAQE
jgi:hypothetical protein